MKIFKTIILAILISLVLVSCTKEDKNDSIFEETIKNPPNSQESLENTEESEEKLTIAAYADYSMQTFVKKYKEKNPEVDIELIDYFDWSIPKTDEEYIEQSKKNSVALENFKVKMSTEIMSGGGPDIINMTELDKYKYSSQGVFVDFYSLMKEDSRYNPDDYYTNIFKNIEYEGELFTLPFGADMDLIYLNKAEYELLGKDYSNIKTITPEEMIETYNKLISEEKKDEEEFLLSEYTGDRAKKNVFDTVAYPGYIDMKNKRADFLNDGFLNYLELSNLLKTSYQPDKFNSALAFSFGSGKLSNFENYLYSFSSFSNSLLAAEETTEYYGPIKLTNIQNQNVFRVPSSYSILKSSKNIDLAWDFLYSSIEEQEFKYSKMLDVDLFSLNLQELQTLLNDDNDVKRINDIYSEITLYPLIPINKNNLKKTFYYAYYFEYFDLNINKRYGRIDELRFNTKEELDENIDKLTAKIEGHIPEFDTEYLPELEILKSIEQDTDNFYYYNSLSKEELAEIIDNKMNLYLTE